MAPCWGALGLRRVTEEAAVLAQLWLALSLLVTRPPFPFLHSDSVVLPAPPPGTGPCKAEHSHSTQRLTRGLRGDRVQPPCSFQQMVLQAALLQSLEQEVPSIASGARRGAGGTGLRAQPGPLPLSSSSCRAWPREPPLQEKGQRKHLLAPSRSGDPPTWEPGGQSNLTIKGRASSGAFSSPWLVPGPSEGELG